MKIAYLCVNDPLDKQSWSGTTYFIAKALQSVGHEVEFLGPLKQPRWLDKTLRAVCKINRILFRQEYITKYSLLLSLFCAKRFKRKLKGKTFDCIVAPAASAEVAFLKTELPIVYISDATFKLISNYDYKEFRGVSWISKIEGNILERLALKKSSAIIVSSVWAAESVVRDYKVDKDNVFITPYGANIDETPNRDIIHNKLHNKQLTLLFLGVDWERKGGPIAFDTLKFLHYSHGIDAKLIICGCQPPAQYKHPYMEVIPFLDKNKKEDYNRFVEILTTSHFLIVPTRADCSLLVAEEANAYGIPAITTETGGVPEVVKDGINGYCLPLSAPASTYASLINELFINEDNYKALIESSRKRFEDDLNWAEWAKSFNDIYATRISKTGSVNVAEEEELELTHK